MHTVAFTRAFERAAAAAEVTEAEITKLVDLISRDPTAGDEMKGTGGCRKVRLAGKGRGKSGAYRTITFYTGEQLPVFLLTVFAKGDRANLSKGERNELRKITKEIVAAYQAKISGIDKKGRAR